MGKKGLAAIFSKPKLAGAATDGSPSPPWPWPSCANNPQTASFRRQQRHADVDETDRPCTTAGRSSATAAAAGRLLPCKATGEMYKTVNSVYFDPAAADSASFFDDDEDGEGVGDDALDDCVSYSTTTASEEWSEAVIRSLGRTSTDRFFFDSGPPPASNSILAASRSPSPSPSPGRRSRTQPPPTEPKPPSDAAAAPGTPDQPDDASNSDDDEEHLPPASTASPLVEESVAVALESEDPYGDFRASMAEMVSAHGLRDWASLQEMLLCYLRINAKHNHALIVGAFVDLLIGLAATSSSATTSTATTTTTATMTTTTTAMTAASTRSSSSSSSSVAGDGGASCSTTVEEEQCGGGSGTDASCSPVVSSDQEEDEDEQVRETASDDELALHIRL